MIGRDAPAVYALICLIEDEDQAIRRTSVEDIADMMEGKNGRDWVDTIVGLDAKANICAVASVRVLRGIHEAATAVVSAFIHPHWRGRPPPSCPGGPAAPARCWLRLSALNPMFPSPSRTWWMRT